MAMALLGADGAMVLDALKEALGWIVGFWVARALALLVAMVAVIAVPTPRAVPFGDTIDARSDDNFSIVSTSGQIRAVNSMGTGTGSSPVYAIPRPPPTVDDVTIEDITINEATADVDLTNLGGQTATVYLRYRTPPGSGSWTDVTKQETTGTSVDFDLTGLKPGTEYRVQASTESGYPRSNRAQEDFQTTTQVALTPNPANIDPARLINHRLTPDVSAGVSNVVITVDEPVGDVTFALVESGLDCSSQTHTLTVAAANSFWFRACGAGSVTITVTDDDDSAVSQTYDMTVQEAEASITAVSVPAADIGQTSAEVQVTLSNPDGVSATVYLRYRTPPGSGSWTDVTKQETTGTSVDFDLTGLKPGTEYRVQASTKSGYPKSNRAQEDFQTTTQVALTPNPANIDPARLINHRLTPDVSAGVSNVVITVDEPVGDVTFALVESGLDCSSQTHTLTVAAANSFWFRACGAGSVTITVTDDDDSAVSQTYDMTVQEAEASITAVSVPAADIGQTSAEVQVTLSNPDGVSATVYLRYRTPPGSGSWSSTLTSITTGPSTERTLLTLTANADYRVQVSLSAGFRSHEQEDFTTDATPGAVSGVSAGSITSDGATISITLTNPHSQSETVYTRYRTPVGSGSWTTGPTATTNGTTASVTLSGLDRATEYWVQASTSSSFSDTVFSTTVNTAPDFGATTATRQVYENSQAGTDVGAPVTATDANVHTLTYTVSGTDASSFDIGGGTGQITVGSSTTLDHETKETYSVTVTATDIHSGTDRIAVTIQVLDVDEAGFLGKFTFTVGSSGDDYGYDSGSYGSLVSGDFPEGLFDDDAERTVEEIYEDADGNWHLQYSGGTESEWLSDQESLDSITLVVKYEDRVDTRSFVLGGFIEGEEGTRGLELNPPIPSRDWSTRSGEDVIIEFHRHVGQAAPALPLTPFAEPTAVAGSFVAFLSETTPGGPVIAQTLIVILVFVGFLYKMPATPTGIIQAAVVLVMTPWIPVLFGYGSTISAGIILVNVVAGAFSYKVFAARTES